jgi:predicted nucleic acid-binding protein
LKKSRTIIPDSSVIAKWMLLDEDNVKALDIKNLFVTGQLSIALPALTFYEVNNLLRSAVKSQRIEPEEALRAFDDFLALNLTSYSSGSLLKKALRIALNFDISTYDASYLALAEELKSQFITTDQKLLNKVESKFIIKLEDFEF